MEYRKTSTQIIAEIIDETAKNDSTITTSAQSFSAPNNLKNDNVSTVDYMTNELNYSLLDGTLDEIPEQNNFVYVSSNMSDGDCEFPSGTNILITFSNNHSSAGVTLAFDGHYYPDSINVKYYNASNEIIANDNFTVSSKTFFCNHRSIIENYRKILITFNTSKYPYSFVKVLNIDYGVKYHWGEDEDSSILSASIVEETDIISNNLSMDTCEFTIYNDTEDFNMLALDGMYKIIRQYQKVKVYEIIETYNNSILINHYPKFMGNFFIKEWVSNAQHELTFKCVDLIGVLEDTQFNLGKSYDPYETVQNVIKSIMDCAGIPSTEYTIANNLKNKKLYGVLPVMSCRQALQQVVFCLGAVADCARSETIDIYIPSNKIQYYIPDENNLEYEQIQKNDEVSDAIVSSYYLGSGSSGVKIFEGKLPVGVHKISSPEPIQKQAGGVSPQITVGGDKASLTNDVDLFYFTIDVREEDYFVVTATTYGIKKYTGAMANNPNVKVKKEIKCESNYLTNDVKNPGVTYATEAAKRLIDYYSKPDTMVTEFILNEERTGSWCVCKNKYGNNTKGNILRMDIDLTGGFLAKAKMVCVEDIAPIETSYVCGSELYAGETNDDNIGLI